MYLLDTCVISELRKLPSERADAAVVRWAVGAPRGECWLSAVTVKELEYGTLLVERRDPRQGVVLRTWLDQVLTDFAGRVVPVDDRVARRAAALHVPDPAPEADAYIAATALVHGLCLATRNTADFARFARLRLVDPWAPPS